MNLVNITDSEIHQVSETKDWHSWINLMPPPPNDFHVVGDVLVANPGVEVYLTPTVSPSINPTILLLDLILVQKPGVWPQVQTLKEARYSKVVKGIPYITVQILSEGSTIAEMPVETVH